MQPTIHRSERICIDISDNVVSIIKLDPEGVMIKVGSAKAPSLPTVPDDAYVTDLSSAIRKAAWAANISTSFGVSCVVVAGMPGAIIQRFTWPDMPADALHSIVHEEMTPYLPGDPTHYTIGYEILRLEQNSLSHPATLEILAAAMPIEFTSAITTACRWANFKPKRMDLREGARGRLAHFWCAPVEGEVPSTYAILDVGPGVANIAFYHDGLFHSNRYFTPEFVKLDEVDDFELLMTVKTGGIDDNENAMRYDPDKLAGEVISSIDHFYRSVSRVRLSCILLMDDENLPGVEESLRDRLDMLILKPEQWVAPGTKRPNLRRVDQAQFLDAFAAGMPPLTGHGSRMDLQMSDIPPIQAGHHMAVNHARHIAHHETYTTESTPSMTGFPEQNPGPFADIIPGPIPFEDSAPARHPEPVSGDFSDLYADMISERARASETLGPIGHEFPLDPSRNQTDRQSGFPYAMPDETPVATNSKRPILAAIAVAAVVLLITVLIPLRTTLSLRSELRSYQESIASHTPADALFMLEQERVQSDRQISAIRRDIQYVNERKTLVRNFYLNPPALIIIPEVLYNAGIHVDSIVANEHQVIITGRTNAFRVLFDGTRYLREESPYHHLFSVAFDPDNDGALDDYGFMSYTITITLHRSQTTFWLNRNIERWW